MEGFLASLGDQIVGYVMDSPDERDCWVRLDPKYRDDNPDDPEKEIPIRRKPVTEAWVAKRLAG